MAQRQRTAGRCSATTRAFWRLLASFGGKPGWLIVDVNEGMNNERLGTKVKAKVRVLDTVRRCSPLKMNVLKVVGALASLSWADIYLFIYLFYKPHSEKGK